MTRRVLSALLAIACGCLIGCSNPDAHATATVTSRTGSPGEPPAPPPPSPASQASSAALQKPQKTLERYARLYINWNYRNLTKVERLLTAEAVGAARITERQAAASAGRDQTLRRAKVWNSGSVLSVAPDLDSRGRWVIVTLERTGGSGEYAQLPAGFHVTLAEVSRARAGWAVSSWEPES